MLRYWTVNFVPYIEEFDYELLNLDISNYALAISENGSPLLNCFGYVDGTLRPICCPLKDQRACYSGHKRAHGIKFESVTFPSGFIGRLSGPVEGQRHDRILLRESGLLESLQHAVTAGYCLYGDPAYPLTPNLIIGYRGSGLSSSERNFNLNMNKGRVTVEWGFGIICATWAFLDFKKQMKVHLSPVGNCYKVGALLTNIRNCFSPNSIAQTFSLRPPSPEFYLSQIKNRPQST